VGGCQIDKEILLVTRVPMVRIVLVVICVAAVIFLFRVLAALLREWMAPAAQPIRMHVAKFYPSRKRGELVAITVNPPQRQFPRKVAERIALLLLVAIGMAISLRIA
jgi:hypothetical protein